MEPAKTKVTVEIYGESYPLKGDVDTAHIERVAAFLDERMRETAGRNFRLSTAKVAVLAALNVADEYLRLQEDYRKLVAIMNKDKS